MINIIYTMLGIPSAMKWSESAMWSIEVASPPNTVVLFYTFTFTFKKLDLIVFEIY